MWVVGAGPPGTGSGAALPPPALLHMGVLEEGEWGADLLGVVPPCVLREASQDDPFPQRPSYLPDVM